MSQFLDSLGEPIRLGPKLGTGGEGTVYSIVGHPDAAAKIYHTPPTKDRVEKITAMPNIATPTLKSVTAWPTDVILTAKQQVVGLLMPKLRGYKDIHHLYGPRSRKSEFPDADFPFLIHAAANLARAFATVHDLGCVIGDVNHGGVTVSQAATTKLIDCDSFQVKADNRLFFCDVGIATFMPPELQRQPLRNVQRTINHDNFALAVLLFHLLFMGRHPFAGRYLGTGDMPIETAIQQYRFAYAADRSQTQMVPPPNLPSLATLSVSIATLFERAFSKRSANGHSRPTATEWASALGNLTNSLVSCKSDRRHAYLKGLPDCPWCQMEAAAGIVLFNPNLISPRAGKAFNTAHVWAAIAAVSLPAPPPLPREEDLPNPAPAPEAVKQRDQRNYQARKKWFVTAPLVALVLLGFIVVPELFYLWLIGGWFLYSAISEDNGPAANSTFTEALRRAEDRYRQSHSRYIDFISSDFAAPGPFYRKKKELEGYRDTWNAFPAKRSAGLKALEKNRRTQQLDIFLSNFFLDHARVAGIGAGRKAVLTSYGIHTASDVERQRIMNVPGFGQTMTQKLIDWRRKLERKFVFDPSKGVDPAAVQSLDQQLKRERIKLEKALIAGASELQQVKRRLEAQYRVARNEVEQALIGLVQARVNKTTADG